MTFRITVNSNLLGVEFEVGSISETIGILDNESTNIGTLFTKFANLTGGTDPVTVAAEPAKKPGRPRTKNQPDPATAQAPAPAPVPGPTLAAGPITSTDTTVMPPNAQVTPTAPPAPAAPPPLPNAPAMVPGMNVPDFLKRAPDNSLPIAPPPAPLAPPPPSAPVAVERLADKVVAKLKEMAGTHGEAGIVTWLHNPCGIVQAGSTFGDALGVVQILPDDKVMPLAKSLQLVA